MANQIQCPNCGQTYDLTPEQIPQYAGQTITCTQCQKPFTVPANIAAPGSHVPPFQTSDRPGVPPAYPNPQSQTHYLPPQPEQSNPLAIISLICGLLAFCIPVLPAIIGIVLGILGLQKTRDPRVKGKGLAIAGISVSACSLLLSMVFVMFAMMGSTMLPSLNRARETANRVKCASNMRQIGQAVLLYANENQGHYPPDLVAVLRTQDVTSDVFVCPTTNDKAAPPGATPQSATLPQGSLSYIYVGKNLTSGATKSDVVLYEPFTNHNDGTNMLFGDGSVQWLTKQQAQPLIDRAKARPAIAD
jgi:predicted Zn finger-like uncharacterized protein/prepilin-type processing-associated H-X9-DG protein